MKNLFRVFVLLLVLGAVSCGPKSREVVILSTNDVHAHIERFAQLATAVERCRDTVDVILVDAGDRWTGNSYVDLAEDRMPILELMNRLGYDLAALGNHEFDVGQQSLERAVAKCGFPIICGNINCEEGAVLKPFDSSRIISRGDIKVGFTSVVTNYGPNGHPDGHDEIFENLSFEDAVDAAVRLESEIEGRCDVKIALTHIGLDRDREVAERSGYNVIIGGHSHDRANEVVNGVLINQAWKNLFNVGVTTIRLRGDVIEEISFRMVPLEGYEPDAEYEALVDGYYSNPDMLKSVGELHNGASRVGLANMFAESVRVAADCEVGIYHYGGVRLDSLAGGSVRVADIYDLDPFGSYVAVVNMTRDELRDVIIAKFNDTVNPKESHTIDLFATTPYTVVKGENGDAVDVLFPELKPRKEYKVALGDYIFKNYLAIPKERGEVTNIKVTDTLLEMLKAGVYAPQNELLQSIK